MNKEDKRVFKEIENILFSYKKYKRLNKDRSYDDLLKKIDVALQMIEDCKNYNFIEMRYFNKMSYEDIANELVIDVRSVYYIRTNLLGKLRFHFRVHGLLY